MPCPIAVQILNQTTNMEMTFIGCSRSSNLANSSIQYRYNAIKHLNMSKDFYQKWERLASAVFKAPYHDRLFMTHHNLSREQNKKKLLDLEPIFKTQCLRGNE